MTFTTSVQVGIYIIKELPPPSHPCKMWSGGAFSRACNSIRESRTQKLLYHNRHMSSILKPHKFSQQSFQCWKSLTIISLSEPGERIWKAWSGETRKNPCPDRPPTDIQGWSLPFCRWSYRALYEQSGRARSTHGQKEKHGYRYIRSEQDANDFLILKSLTSTVAKTGAIALMPFYPCFMGIGFWRTE